MKEIIVAYWSGTGNTAAMAQMVAQGIAETGKEAKVVSVEEFAADGLKDSAVFALGCPSMGNEVLEESVMEDFVTEVEGFASGKTIGLFGSYGWGDGEWMRNWVERMQNAGATVYGGEDAICMGEPDAEAEDKLVKLGKTLGAI
jgi:flavodoxin short chain